MKQSERIRRCREYQNHPLKKEYEAKKSKITKKPFYYYIIILSALIPIILFFYYLYVFSTDAWGTGWGTFFAVIILGIINIFLGGLWIFLGVASICSKIVDVHNEASYRKLDDEYKEKGLIPITEHELYEHECCEFDDWKETYVCSATKQPLSYRDAVGFCKQPGNCRYCRAFVTAYLGPDGPKYWSEEFKR